MSSKTKTSLSIRLTESVVLLRTDARNRPSDPDSPSQSSGLIRGLLVLNLSKPTKISSIEVMLEGKGRNSWTEGARNILWLSST
jgi:hypothetical protein